MSDWWIPQDEFQKKYSCGQYLKQYKIFKEAIYYICCTIFYEFFENEPSSESAIWLYLIPCYINTSNKDMRSI